MQGLYNLDLAKVISDGHHEHRNPHFPTPRADRTHKVRHWAGTRLIRLGERLAPRPAELQLKVSTGPPFP